MTGLGYYLLGLGLGLAGATGCDTGSGVVTISYHYVTAAYTRSSQKSEKINFPRPSSENMQKLELKPSSYLGGGGKTRIGVSFLTPWLLLASTSLSLRMYSSLERLFTYERSSNLTRGTLLNVLARGSK